MRVNNKWLAVLLILGLVSLSGCGLPVVKKLRARDYLNKGVTQFSNQKHDAAAQFFQKSLELDPDFEIARMYLATAYMSQFIPGSRDPRNEQMVKMAIETFEKVVANSEAAGTPNVNAMLYIVSMYSQTKDYSNSKIWCDRVLKVDPSNAEAYYRVAVMNYDAIIEQTGLQGEKVKSLSTEEVDGLRDKIEEGLNYISKALSTRTNYFEAMEYQNYLWREKAKLETDDTAKAELIRQADMVALESLKIKRKAQEDAAKRPKAAPKAR
jgi:tetratricopeptide (TPR) repeat protein